jgi:uncharacterized RDD family membrane protein YckC
MSLTLAFIQFVYFFICIAVWGRTLGGKILGLHCVNIDGDKPAWEASGIRASVPFGFNLLGLIPILGAVASIVDLVNYLAMLWSPEKQTWMDKAAGTYVVYKPSGTALPEGGRHS